jgi:hypothetical protein
MKMFGKKELRRILVPKKETRFSRKLRNDKGHIYAHRLIMLSGK